MAHIQPPSVPPANVESEFGTIPTKRIESIDVKHEIASLRSLYESIRQGAFENPAPKQDKVLLEIEQLRTGIGAVWLRLWRDLDRDLSAAHSISGELWSCLVWSLRFKFKPQKYFSLCGREGFAGLSVMLLNVPYRDECLPRWGFKSEQDHLNTVNRARAILHEREEEYRQIAIAIAQIGVGFAGMLLGLIGMLLGFASAYLTLLTLHS